MSMKAKIRRVEEGVALVSDEPLFDQLGLDDGADVEVSTNGAAFVVTPVHAELHEILDEMHEEYGSVFRRLAE